MFKPTYLYVKRHNVTGLLYLGKTIRKDPIKYKGSGLYWARHLDAHGNDVSTVWTKLYFDQDTLTAEALALSEIFEVMKSSNWANLVIEDGTGGITGFIHSEISKKLMSDGHKGKPTWNKGLPQTEEVKRAVSNKNSGKPAWNKGKRRTDEEKALMSLRRREGNARKKEAGLPTCWNQGTERSESDRMKMKEGWERLKEKGFTPWNKGRKQ